MQKMPKKMINNIIKFYNDDVLINDKTHNILDIYNNKYEQRQKRNFKETGPHYL